MRTGKWLVSLILAGVVFMSNGSPAKAETVDLYGEYHAALGVQTDSSDSVYRDAYFDGENEKEEGFRTLIKGTPGKVGYQILDGKFRDVTIKGNGTYTVSLTNADFDSQRAFRQLYVATDIPNNKNSKIKFSNLSVSINDRVYRTFDKPAFDTTKKVKQNCVLLAIHPTNPEVRNAFSRWTVPTSSENVIKIQFTVKGFGYKKGEEPVRPTPTPEPTETPVPVTSEIPEQTIEPDDSSPISGITQKQGKNTLQEESVTQGESIGIVITIVFAVAGIIISIVVVSRRKH